MLKPGTIVRYEPGMTEMDAALHYSLRPLPLTLGIIVLGDAHQNQNWELQEASYVVFPPDVRRFIIFDEDLVEIGAIEP